MPPKKHRFVLAPQRGDEKSKNSLREKSNHSKQNEQCRLLLRIEKEIYVHASVDILEDQGLAGRDAVLDRRQRDFLRRQHDIVIHLLKYP